MQSSGEKLGFPNCMPKKNYIFMNFSEKKNTQIMVNFVSSIQIRLHSASCPETEGFLIVLTTGEIKIGTLNLTEIKRIAG